MPTAAVKINLADNTLAGNSAAVVAALNAAGVGESPRHDLGEVTGTVTFDFANGSRQYCAINGNVTFAATGGAAMDEMKIGIAYTTNTHTLDFSGVKMPAAAAALLPVTLEQWRCYLVTLCFLGGGWTLMDISPANTESED